MTISAATVFEVRTGGANTNGGGFVTGASGTDWTQQDAAQYSVTDGVTAGTTTITSATANFGTDVVGNLIYVTGGTGSVVAAWYQITSRTNSTTIVVDRSTGLTAGTGVTLKIGGGLLTLAQVALIAQPSNKCYIKAGTYSTGTQIDLGSTWGSYVIEGYQTTRGDLGTKPKIQASAAIALFKAQTPGAGTNGFIRNIEFDGNSTGTTGITATTVNSNTAITLDRCAVHDFTTAGLDGTAAQTVNAINCDFYNNPIGAGNSSAQSVLLNAVGCIFRNNTNYGVRRPSAGSVLFDCLAYGNGASGGGGFDDGMNGTFIFINCTAYNNTGFGFGSPTANSRVTFYINCISYGNSTYGFDQTTSDGAFAYNCATGSNTSGAYNNVTQISGNVALTADPFTNKAGNDFSLNAVGGGGTACRATGYPGTFPGGSSVGCLDIGAVQHRDAANPLSLVLTAPFSY